MAQCKISIILPVYNVEKYIRNCIESLIQQFPFDGEIILVDDGGKDSCGDICDEYASQYDFISVIHKENGGLATARNAGLELAKGAYVAFIDPDDWVEKDYLKILSACADEKKDLAVFRIQVEQLDFGTSSSIPLDEKKSITAKESFMELTENGYVYSSCNKLYKRSIIEQEPKLRFRANSEPGEDFIFNCGYYRRISSVAHLDCILYHYMRYGVESLANGFKKDLYQRTKIILEEVDKLFEFYSCTEEDLAVYALLYVNYIKACIPNMYRKKHKFKRKERLDFYSDILANAKIRDSVKRVKDESYLTKKFVRLYKKGSPRAFDLDYSFNMFVRNNFKSIYEKIRRHKKNF